MSAASGAYAPSNPDCTDARPGERWSCVEFDGTGMWCESCLAFVGLPASASPTSAWGSPHQAPEGRSHTVEAAHQRVHLCLGTECRQIVFGEVRPNIGCTELDVAYAALDEDDPELIEMPWRSGAPADPVFGALARAEALAAGDPDWMNCKQWPRPENASAPAVSA